MTDKILAFQKTRRQLAWEFVRTVWGSRADFPDGKQYPGIVAKLAAGFTVEQLREAICKASLRPNNSVDPNPRT